MFIDMKTRFALGRLQLCTPSRFDPETPFSGGPVGNYPDFPGTGADPGISNFWAAGGRPCIVKEGKTPDPAVEARMP